MTATLTYDEKGCIAPAKMVTMTQELSCTPQVDRYNPLCERNDVVYFFSDCLDFYDALSRGFYVEQNWQPYLLVQNYDDDQCGDQMALQDATAYRLDGTLQTCYTNHLSTKSAQIAFDESVMTYTTYNDPHCNVLQSQVALSWMNVTGEMVRCMGNARFELGGRALDMMKTVVVYEDSSCSGPPTKVSMTRGFECLTETQGQVECVDAGGSHSSVSSCTSVSYSDFAMNVFGNYTPYLIVEKLPNSWCKTNQDVDVYIADGVCHVNRDGTTSFRVAINGGTSVDFATYSDTTCGSIEDQVTVAKRDLLSWSCNSSGRRFSVGGLGGPPRTGDLTTLLTYDNDECRAPATVVSMRQELGCQKPLGRPVCEPNGMGSTTSDCMDFSEALYASFYPEYSWEPYLLVQTFDSTMDSCGDQLALIEATAYRLDAKGSTCYVTDMGTKSSQVVLESSTMTYTTHDGPYCKDLSSQIELSWMNITEGGCMGNMEFRLGGPSQDMMKAVSSFEDSACSGTPAKVTLTRSFDCIGGIHSDSKSNCAPQLGSYSSISSCTSASHVDVAMESFGNSTPYLIVETYPTSWCKGYQDVEVYVADGSCRANPDRVGSFRVTISETSSVNLDRYSDPACETIEASITVMKRNLLYRSCDESGHIYSVGGLGGPPATGKMTARLTYPEKGCVGPAKTVALTQELACTTQINQNCARDDEVYHFSYCLDMYDALSRGFYVEQNWQPYLLVQNYDDDQCGDQMALQDATAYRLDGTLQTCYPNHLSTKSAQIAFDESVMTYTTYNDPHCNVLQSQVALSWMNVTGEMVQCMGNARFELGGRALDMMKTVVVYEDSSCSGPPTKVSMTRGFECLTETQGQVECVDAGGSHSSVSSCTSVSYSDFAMNVFGNYTPYLIVEKFPNSWCKTNQDVDVYIADGVCHVNRDDMTSFRATITATSSVELVTYEDTYCGAVNRRKEIFRRDLLSGSCQDNGDWDTNVRYSVGGLNDRSLSHKMELVSVFDESSCYGVPVQLIATNQPACSTSEGLSCRKVSDGNNHVYEHHDCVDSVVDQAKSLFAGTPFLVMERYAVGTDCLTQARTIVYNADGKCHQSIVDGTYFKVSPSDGASLTFASYPTSSCNDFDAEYFTVGAKYINSGACYDGSARLYANMTALGTPAKPEIPVMDVDSMTREQIMFPEWLWEPTPRRVFVSD